MNELQCLLELWGFSGWLRCQKCLAFWNSAISLPWYSCCRRSPCAILAAWLSSSDGGTARALLELCRYSESFGLPQLRNLYRCARVLLELCGSGSCGLPQICNSYCCTRVLLEQYGRLLSLDLQQHYILHPSGIVLNSRRMRRNDLLCKHHKSRSAMHLRSRHRKLRSVDIRAMTPIHPGRMTTPESQDLPL